MPIPKRDRTPSRHRGACAGVRCLERQFPDQDDRPPVKLVVFDCDETLTLATLMPNDPAFPKQIGWSQFPEYVSEANFESPFVDGSRIQRLKDLLSDLKGKDRSERLLAVLTRNELGPIACLNLLMMSGLAHFFSVVWALPASDEHPNGAFNMACTQSKNEWRAFSPPVAASNGHKLNVLVSVTESVEGWFPQIAEGVELDSIKNLKLENIVLVDDVRENLQNPVEKDLKLLRYCKVARYDGNHPQIGFTRNMGGIGAKNISDYATLKRFVSRPWEHRATSELHCMEREFAICREKPGVDLIVFEFDETLSLCTFVNEDHRFSSDIGYLGAISTVVQQYRLYNFESPYVDGSRVEKLDSFLRIVGRNRTLAILTENSQGAVAVLNLLKTAGLADHFIAVWAPSAESKHATGVYRESGEWKKFACPVGRVDGKSHRAQMIHMIVDSPVAWFPQLHDPPPELHTLRSLAAENILVVDDDRTSFISSSPDADDNCAATPFDERDTVPRYCKVASYDGWYRDQGFIIHMGGIGAKSDTDYAVLADFVERPWSSSAKDLRKGRQLDGVQPVPDSLFSLCADNPSLSGAALLGLAGGICGGAVGCVGGALLSVPMAFVTFGLAIPVGAGAGAFVGTTVAGTAGAASGAAAGYLWRTVAGSSKTIEQNGRTV